MHRLLLIAALLVPFPAIAADSVQVSVSGDYYKGWPAFYVLVDGVRVGATLNATVPHSQRQSRTITIPTTADAPKDIGVRFINDAWGGTAIADRNLYVQDVRVNGVDWGPTAHSNPAGFVSATETGLFSNGTAHWRVACPK